MGKGRRLRRGNAAKWLLSVLTIIFMTVPVTAQVHIVESATISPVQPRNTDAGGVVTHDLRFVLSWDSHVTSRLLIEAAPCGMTLGGTVYGSDSIVVSVPHAPAGQYCFEPQMGVTLPGQVTHAVFSIYLDGTLVRSESATTGSSETDIYIIWPNGGICYGTPYNSDFDFELVSKYFVGDPYIPEVNAEDACDSTAWTPSDPLTCSIISGSEHASFHDAATGVRIGTSITTTGDSLGNYMLEFDGVYPDSTSWIVIQATSDGLTKTDSVQISGRPIVRVDPREIPTGDTARLDVQWNPVLSGPGFVSFYEAGIISGGKYGSLLTGSGDTASYLPYTGSQFRFVASGSIDSDSVRVGIRVGAAVGMLEKASPGGGGKVVESTAKPNGVPGSESRKGVLTIRRSPEIADGFMYPDYTIAYVEVVSANRPKLVILQPTVDSPDDMISAVPQMPTVVCKAQLKNYNGGMVTYKWQYRLRALLPDRGEEYIVKEPTSNATTTAQDSAATTWGVPFTTKSSGEQIFRGGQVKLTVNATTSDGKTYSTSLSPNSILGDNPSPAEARSGVSLQMQVVMYLESSFRQFETSKSHGTVGYPLYGPPHGYGIAQLDPPSDENQLWNWKENRAEGVSRLNAKYQRALTHPDSDRAKALRGALPIGYQNATDFTFEKLWKETFKLYNGGYYWKWVPVDPDDPNSLGKWVELPKSSYGTKAWYIYQHPLW